MLCCREERSFWGIRTRERVFPAFLRFLRDVVASCEPVRRSASGRAKIYDEMSCRSRWRNGEEGEGEEGRNPEKSSKPTSRGGLFFCIQQTQHTQHTQHTPTRNPCNAYDLETCTLIQKAPLLRLSARKGHPRCRHQQPSGAGRASGSGTMADAEYENRHGGVRARRETPAICLDAHIRLMAQ